MECWCTAENRVKRLPLSRVGWSLLAELGRASRADQLSHRCRSEIALDGVWSLACNSRGWWGYSFGWRNCCLGNFAGAMWFAQQPDSDRKHPGSVRLQCLQMPSGWEGIRPQSQKVSEFAQHTMHCVKSIRESITTSLRAKRIVNYIKKMKGLFNMLSSEIDIWYSLWSHHNFALVSTKQWLWYCISWAIYCRCYCIL